MSADWPALTSTLNDPVDEALFLGDDLQSSVGNGFVQLATLTLEIKQSAVTLINGTIKVLRPHLRPHLSPHLHPHLHPPHLLILVPTLRS